MGWENWIGHQRLTVGLPACGPHASLVCALSVSPGASAQLWSEFGRKVGYDNAMTAICATYFSSCERAMRFRRSQ
jgi:hypothetical protein